MLNQDPVFKRYLNKMNYKIFLKKQFDDLVEVFTDKLVAKIPSTCSGTVKEILYNSDDICLVGHSLLSIELDDNYKIE